MRFDIPYSDVFPLNVIKSALVYAEAKNVRQRRAFGWRNQPHVATFEAANDETARAVADKATDIAKAMIGRTASLPVLRPFAYKGG